MKSANSYDLPDLERDLPTSREDVQALRRGREPRMASFAAYLDFLAQFPHASTSSLRSRKGPAGKNSFEL